MSRAVRVREAAKPAAATPVVRERLRTGGLPTGLFDGKAADATRTEEPAELEMKSYASRQVLDPFDKIYSAQLDAKIGIIIKPPYTPEALIRLPNMNSMLKQCIDAYVVNIDSFGSRFEYIGEETEDGQPKEEALAELDRLNAFIDAPNGMYSLIELRQRLRRDIETLGYGFIEVGRDEAGNVDAIYHIPAHTIRLMTKDTTPVTVEQKIIRDKKTIKKKRHVHFRRFVQDVYGKKVYFKEFGDPRNFDPTTGAESNSLAIEERATELLHIGLYTPGDVYGQPRWINQFPSVLGSREAELTNLQFFKDNAIPAMAVLVSGGTLSEEAVRDIKAKFTSRRGADSLNRIVIVEATSDQESASESGQTPAPRVDIKPLANERQNDAHFQEYDMQCSKKIRSSFRLPPIFVGLSDDMTHATAQASLTVTENQVFGPERNKLDDIFNQQLLLIDGEQPKYWRFRSQAPRITNPEDVSEALRNLNLFGAMSPNEATTLANELFDLSMPQSEDAWAKYPFDLVLAVAASGRLKGIEEIQGPPIAGGEGPEGAKKEEQAAKASELLQERLTQRRTRHIAAPRKSPA